MLALAVDVNGEGQILAWLEQVDLFLKQERIGAEVNVLLARNQTFDNLRNLRDALTARRQGSTP